MQGPVPVVVMFVWLAVLMSCFTCVCPNILQWLFTRLLLSFP